MSTDCPSSEAQLHSSSSAVGLEAIVDKVYAFCKSGEQHDQAFFVELFENVVDASRADVVCAMQVLESLCCSRRSNLLDASLLWARLSVEAGELYRNSVPRSGIGAIVI